MQSGEGLFLSYYRYLVLTALLTLCLRLVARAQDVTPPEPQAPSQETKSPIPPPPTQTPVFPGPGEEKVPDKSEDSVSSLIKLGPGDLVNFSVYGVPEMD